MLREGGPTGTSCFFHLTPRRHPRPGRRVQPALGRWELLVTLLGTPEGGTRQEGSGRPRRAMGLGAQGAFLGLSWEWTSGGECDPIKLPW